MYVSSASQSKKQAPRCARGDIGVRRCAESPMTNASASPAQAALPLPDPCHSEPKARDLLVCFERKPIEKAGPSLRSGRHRSASMRRESDDQCICQPGSGRSAPPRPMSFRAEGEGPACMFRAQANRKSRPLAVLGATWDEVLVTGWIAEGRCFRQALSASTLGRHPPADALDRRSRQTLSTDARGTHPLAGARAQAHDRARERSRRASALGRRWPGVILPARNPAVRPGRSAGRRSPRSRTARSSRSGR